jgi:iron complex outermembrane receptor protein
MKLNFDNYPKWIFVANFLLLGSFVFGQRNITGFILDAETNEPLIGASVLVQGTETGTVADIDGSFAITIPDGFSVLNVSYTGYESQSINLADNPSNAIEIRMSAGTTLDEVVVIGYGTVKREDLTGSVQTVDSEVFNKGAITGPQELLAGKVAGVSITPGDGSPGGGAAIRIRGGSSLTASNNPLVVVDGVPIDNGGVSGSRNFLNFINPNDIETFTVLKDASATAIYGSRASNGVILITTKKGNLGKQIKVNYTGNLSISERIEPFDVLDADEFRATVIEQFGDGHPAVSLLGDANTDWQNEVFETAIGSDHNLSLSGGIAEVLPYRVSVGYTDRKGILKTDKFERTTASVNLSPGFLDNTLQVNANVKGMRSKNRFADRSAIWTANSFDPTQPIRDESSPYGGFFTWTNIEGFPNGLAPKNPVSYLEMKEDLSEVNRVISNATFDYRFWFLDDLRANLNLAYDYSEGEGTIVIPDNAPFAFNPDPNITGGANNRYHQIKKNKLLEFYLNYNKEIGNSNLEVMGGYSWQEFFEENGFANNNFAMDLDPEMEVLGDTIPLDDHLVSLFGRVNYTIDDKYLITATLRQDASSRFSEDTRYGLFPAVALGWKVFDSRAGTLNSLKLRAGWGITGQQDIGGNRHPYLPLYKLGQDNAQYQFGNEFVTTLRPGGYDTRIKWEETTTYNVGVDFGLLNDRITGTLEYYFRESRDLLNFVPVAAGTNLTNFLTTNIGNLNNEGIELTLNTVPVLTEKLRWDFGFNVARNNNEITKLIASDDPNYQGVFVGGIAGGVGNTVQIHSVGFPASSFFVFEQVYDESGFPIEGLYVDRNGDGAVTPDDRYRLEQPAADYIFGFNSNMSFGNFNFSFAGRANVGNYIYNNIQSDQAIYSRIYHPTNYLNNVHSDVESIRFENPEYLSDHFIQDASFLKIDHITLTYNFNNLFGKTNSIGLSAIVQNPFVITNYTGIDPEVFGGIDGNSYPRVRNFVFGLNANF